MYPRNFSMTADPFINPLADRFRYTMLTLQEMEADNPNRFCGISKAKNVPTVVEEMKTRLQAEFPGMSINVRPFEVDNLHCKRTTFVWGDVMMKNGVTKDSKFLKMAEDFEGDVRVIKEKNVDMLHFETECGDGHIDQVCLDEAAANEELKKTEAERRASGSSPRRARRH